MKSRSTYRSSVPLSAAHGVTRPVVGQMFHVKHWLLCRWCSGRCRALLWGRSAVCAGGRRPAREPSAPRVVVCCALVFWAPEAPAAREIATREPAARSGRCRSPPVPSGPSGALHTGGAVSLTCGRARRLEARPGPAGPAAASDRACLCVPWPCRRPRVPQSHLLPAGFAAASGWVESPMCSQVGRSLSGNG